MRLNKKLIATMICIMLFAPLFIKAIPAKADLPPSYTIKFDANDGTGVCKKIKKDRNVEVAVPDCGISHEGFILMGWSAKKNSTFAEIKNDGMIDYNKNTTLYAVWRTVGENELFYNKPGRPIKASNTSVKKGKTVTLKAYNQGEGKCKFKFKSSNKKVLKVSSSGKAKAIKPGKVVVTITSKEDGLYAKSHTTITVTVKK